MALGIFKPKVLRAEVTAGLDLESGVLLTGERITVGTGPGDDLRLGAQNVVAGHLTFQRTKTGGPWEYFSSDRGHTAVSNGNPRTGPVRPGLSFVLGGETRIDILSVPAPADLENNETAGSGTTVPLTVALPLMGAMLVAFALYIGALSGGSEGSGGLRTTPWFEGTSRIETALETCLASGLSPEARALGSAATSGQPDALFRASLAAESADPGRQAEVRADLAAKVLGHIADAHLLLRENKPLEASGSLRRLEYVLPVGNGDCPILSAARLDLAILELWGGQS